jgi:predicted dinucleotide-binding enzyme
MSEEKEKQNKKRIGVLGSGDVGKALASGFLNCGYEVKIGSRSPAEKLNSWVKAQGEKKVSSGTFSEAAAFGDVVVLSTLGEGTSEAIEIAGAKNFYGKLVIDTSNPLDFSKGMPPGLLSEFSNSSLGEFVQKKLPKSSVVKCFNTVPHVVMFKPRFPKAKMLICGNSSGAKDEIREILREFGWSGAIDIGGIENSRWLESLVVLWVRAALASQTFDSMFMFVQ